MQFAKLENGILKRCPKTGMIGKSYHTDLPLYYERFPEKAYANGWLELVETDKPEGNYIPRYKEDGHQLIQYWEKLPDPEPQPDPMRQIEQNTANIEFMAVYLDVPISEMTEVLDDAQ